VQSVVVDSLDRLWVLDTGRVQDPNGTIVEATVGGPKLVGINLSNNTVFQTIIFPANVAPGDSYLNDVRFDLRPNVTSSGKGIAYITDSSIEGRTGLVIVDLGTGESWRHLQGSTYVAPAQQFLAYVWGRPIYAFMPGQPLSFQGLALMGLHCLLMVRICSLGVWGRGICTLFLRLDSEIMDPSRKRLLRRRWLVEGRRESLMAMRLILMGLFTMVMLSRTPSVSLIRLMGPMRCL